MRGVSAGEGVANVGLSLGVGVGGSVGETEKVGVSETTGCSVAVKVGLCDGEGRGVEDTSERTAAATSPAVTRPSPFVSARPQ